MCPQINHKIFDKKGEHLQDMFVPHKSMITYGQFAGHWRLGLQAYFTVLHLCGLSAIKTFNIANYLSIFF